MTDRHEFDDEFDDELDDDDEDDELESFATTTYSISELASAINGVLEDGFDDGVWVWGEISSVSVKGGHTYFTLVEDLGGGKRAQLNVNLWAGVLQRIRPVLKSSGLAIQNGLRVRVRGELDFYAPFGKLSLTMQEIDPRFTLGDIALQREELLRKLKESGRYDANRRPGPTSRKRSRGAGSDSRCRWSTCVFRATRPCARCRMPFATCRDAVTST